MQGESSGAAADGPVRIGAYSLEVAGSGSFARFEPEGERDNARALAAALDEAPDQPPAAVAAIEEFQESADAVTSRIEEADRLLRTAAAGDLLQLDNLSGEIDSLLDLFTRLDKAGRFEEELKLMRSLNGLLALTLRWLDLIRSLLALLRSAKAARHAAGQAFAHHELGSLKLCAGRPDEAARDLGEALRLEEAVGDVVGRCATRHNLDSARRDALRGGRFGRPRGIQRLVVLAGVIAIAAGSGAGIALAIHGDGNNGTGSQATLIVHKNFVPNAPTASVTIAVTCTNGGRPDSSPKSATEATPADFTITRFGKGAICTATENQIPSGYSQNNDDCRNVKIAPGGSVSCTIVNIRSSSSSAIFKVNKDFSDNSPAKVSIGLRCDSGVVATTPIGAAEGSPATFTITRFQSGAMCTATEGTPPSGYTADESDCQRVPIARGSYTIVDTLNTTTLTVRKDYTDSNTSAVLVDLACTSGAIADSRLLASPSSSAVFTITGFDTGATCTATEVHYSGSYNRDESDCKGVPLVSRGECTLVNSPTG